MLFKLLVVFLFILIVALFLLIFSNIHMYVSFKNQNLEYDGNIKINYLLLQLELNIKEKILDIAIKIRSKKIHIYSLNLDKKEDTDESEDGEVTTSDETKDETKDSDDEEENSDDKKQNIKQLLKLLSDAKSDIIEIVTYLPNLMKFKNSNIGLNLGLADNQLTIKVSSLIYMISAILYPANLNISFKPEFNALILKSDVDVTLDIIVVNIIKLLIITIKKESIRNIIKEVI